MFLLLLLLFLLLYRLVPNPLNPFAMTFLCKTELELSTAFRALALDFLFKNRSADETKGLVNAYLGQNRRHYPEDCAFWTDHFRSLFANDGGSLTRAAATGN